MVFATLCHQVNFIMRINAWLFLVVFATLSHQVNFISGGLTEGLTKIQETLADSHARLEWFNVKRLCRYYQQLLYR